MKEVKIADLKAHLSSHLAGVRKGQTIIVFDRSTPIARLMPFKQVQDDDLIIEEAIDPPAAAKKVKPFHRGRAAHIRSDTHRCRPSVWRYCDESGNSRLE